MMTIHLCSIIFKKPLSMQPSFPFLPRLGIHGYSQLEPLLLAALVTRDPLLLIGRAGTGKTFLLNRIAAALELEHRHYNASLVSFDDLVGFPFPDAAAGTVSFLHTPATLWQAGSVLVDEISRCRPEVQNKFFSIIHERRLQGIEVSGLRYRWAAMNPPPGQEDGTDEVYTGSEALDPALADRFGFILSVPDWPELEPFEQEAILRQDTVPEPGVGWELMGLLTVWGKQYEAAISNPDYTIIRYARLVCTLLTQAGWRMSPRRAQQLVRNLTAVAVVSGLNDNGVSEAVRKELFRNTLCYSLPHPAWKSGPPMHIFDAAHAEAWQLANGASDEAIWIAQLLSAASPSVMVVMLMRPDSISRDTRSLGLMRLLHTETPARRALLMVAAYPLWLETDLFTEDTLGELGRFAAPVLAVEGDLVVSNKHSGWAACEQYVGTLPKEDMKRQERARQLFMYLLVNGHEVHNPGWLEMQLQQCFETARRYRLLQQNQKKAA